MLLENKRIRLRVPEPEDVEILYKWENDSSLWEVSNTIAPFSKFQLLGYIENSKEADFYETKQLRFVIEKKETVKPVGMVDLFDFDPFHERAGTGISINENEERRKHYATEALELLSDYSFLYLKLSQLYCNIPTDNKASVELFKSQGFKITGRKEAWLKRRTGFTDVLFLQKLNPQIFGK